MLICDTCQRVKHLSITMEGEYKLVSSEGPRDLICVDFLGPLPRGRGGVEYIFVVLDAFTKLGRLYPLKKTTTVMSLKRLFEDYIPECGMFKRILSDNGTQFTSSKWKSEFEKAGIRVVYSSIRRPQSNPAERIMREISKFCRTFCTTHTSWANHVKNIENLLNITTHHSTKFTPHELHFGIAIEAEIEKLIPFPEKRRIDQKKMIVLARENILKHFNKRKKGNEFSKVILAVNYLLLLRVRHLSNAPDKVSKKFFHLYEEPYRIIKSIVENAFLLANPSNSKMR